MDKSMAGKVCMVTGPTSGIGEATAYALADMGATVVGVGRNPGKCAAVAEQIERQTGCAVEFLLADLSSQAEIRRVAQEFKDRYRRLDVLINNAGAVFMKRQETGDGIEMTLALNHLGYFLLTNLLLDVLKASAPARIVCVSSELHRRARLDFDHLQGQRKYKGMDAYRRSKLCNVLFTYELARRLEGTGVTANVVSPGLVATSLGMNNGGISALMKRLVDRWMGISPEEAAQAVAYLASSLELESVTGRYFNKRQPASSSEITYDEAIARRLWEMSEVLTGSAPGGEKRC